MALKILGVEPKDIHVALDISVTELSMVLDFLDHCEMEYNGKEEPEMVEAKKFVTEEFFPVLNKLLIDIKRGE